MKINEEMLEENLVPKKNHLILMIPKQLLMVLIEAVVSVVYVARLGVSSPRAVVLLGFNSRSK